MNITDPEKITKLIEESAFGRNILPITSLCNAGCTYCCYKYNPSDICSADIGHAEVEQILNAFDFLDPGLPILIGESAGIIIEGEPTLHPEFPCILKNLIKRFPHTPIEIRTNGCNIDEEELCLFKQKDDLKLNISLHSASVRGRQLLMNESFEHSIKTVNNIKRLSEHGISFNGSLAAFPNITGWDDIRHTIKFLNDCNAETIRIQWPSYTKHADSRNFPCDKDFLPEMKELINSVQDELDSPVILEPAILHDLTTEISGVLKKSPAWDAGIRRGDIILSVNNRKPICRTDALNMLSESGPISVCVKSGEIVDTLEWENPRQYCSGITMENDINPARAEYIRELINYNSGKVFLLSSEFGYDIVQNIMTLYGIEKNQAEVVKVKNITFGGNIRAASLLTVDDYLYAINKNSNIIETASLLILPQESFNCDGKDLKSNHHSSIEEKTGINVSLL